MSVAAQCPLLAQSRHALLHCKCLLSGVKQTSQLSGLNVRTIVVPVLGAASAPNLAIATREVFSIMPLEASSKHGVPNEIGNDGLRGTANRRNLLGCRPIPRISARECGAS